MTELSYVMTFMKKIRNGDEEELFGHHWTQLINIKHLKMSENELLNDLQKLTFHLFNL